LRRVVEICSAHNILVISDEIHCDLVLHQTLTHTTTGRVAGDNLSNLVTLMSPSKTFNLAGANCSYAVIPDAKYREAYKEKCMYTLPIIPTLAFTAAQAAYQHGWQWHAELIEYLRGNLQLLKSEIDHMPYLSMDNPDATYLAWVNTAALPVDDVYSFFVNAGVGLSPGAQFGNADYQRLNFACSRAQLKTGIERMKNAIESL
jgi:cystathionine beta-lyase